MLMTYNGGPVEKAPQVYVTYWGASWKQDARDRRQVQAFFDNAAASHWSKVLTQYGARSVRHELRGSWIDTHPVPLRVSQSMVQHEVLRAWRHFHAHSVNSIYVVITPAGHKMIEPFCGYHDALRNVPFIYAADTTYKCLGVTVTLSHEYAEVMTDPLLTGWYDNAGNEIGDKCNSNFSLSVFGLLILPVQDLWSNKNKMCVKG